LVFFHTHLLLVSLGALLFDRSEVGPLAVYPPSNDSLLMALLVCAKTFVFLSFTRHPPFPSLRFLSESPIALFSPPPICFFLGSLTLTLGCGFSALAFVSRMSNCLLSCDAFGSEDFANTCQRDAFRIGRNRVDFVGSDFMPRFWSIHLPSVMRIDDFKDAHKFAF
jgi:hypothetical protein